MTDILNKYKLMAKKAAGTKVPPDSPRDTEKAYLKPTPEAGSDLMDGVDLDKVAATRTYAPATGRLGTLAVRLRASALTCEPGKEPGNPVVFDILPGVVIVAIPLQYPSPSRDATALFLTSGGRSHPLEDEQGLVHADCPLKVSLGVGRYIRQSKREDAQ